MPKKQKSVQKVSAKKEKILKIKEEKPQKRIFKTIWFSLGIFDFIWTIFWLIYSLNQKDLYNLASVVFFAAGFYIFCFFILITLVYYLIKMAMRFSKRND